MVDMSAFARPNRAKKAPEPILPVPSLPPPSAPAAPSGVPLPPPAPPLAHAPAMAPAQRDRAADEAFARKLGAEVAEAARLALVASVGRVASRIGALRWAITLASVSGALALGYAAGSHNAARIDGHAIPPALASVLAVQDWASQWAACRKQPAINGIEWCLMPMVTKAPKLPN